MFNKLTVRALFLVSLFCLLTGGGKAYAGTLGELINFSTLNNYSPNGKAWKSNFTIDWDTQYLEIVIDATTRNAATSGPDNLFSIAATTVTASQYIDWSSINGSSIMVPILHAYSGGDHQNDIALHNFYYVASTTKWERNDATVNGVTDTNRKSITFRVSKADGLQVKLGETGTLTTYITAATLSDDFFNTNMTIGSEEGSARMQGTYTSVTVKNIGSSNATITNVLPASGSVIADVLPDGITVFPFKATGQFAVTKDIDWDTQKVVAQVDLSTCSGENDFFAMTTGDGDFTNFNGTLENPNLHCFYTPDNGYFSSYLHDSSGTDTETGVAENAPSGHITLSSDIVDLEFSKADGSVFNGVKNATQSPNIRQYQHLFQSSTVKLGNGETSKSHNATYNYIRIVSADYTTGSTTTSNVLNEAAENTFAAQDNVNISLKRSFVAGTWNTICLPFDVSADVIAKKLGNAELCTLSSVSNNVMNFDAATSIKAGKPYLIKPANDVADPTFESVNLKADAPELVSPSDGWGMKGTYGLTTLATDGTNLFIVADNKFKKPGNESQAVMKGMRAYFIVPIGTSPSALRANIDGVETAISAINIENSINDSDNNVYNLQGQRVGTTLQGLPRGLYIQNGKKMIIK